MLQFYVFHLFPSVALMILLDAEMAQLSPWGPDCSHRLPGAPTPRCPCPEAAHFGGAELRVGGATPPLASVLYMALIRSPVGKAPGTCYLMKGPILAPLHAYC